MGDYLTANREEDQGDHRARRSRHGIIKRVFDQVGVKPGEIPVVGWGNSLDTTQEVLAGYVNAAEWQDPQATSYVALSLATWRASGIPPGFNIHSARSTRRTRRPSTTRSCPASRPALAAAALPTRAQAAASPGKAGAGPWDRGLG